MNEAKVQNKVPRRKALWGRFYLLLSVVLALGGGMLVAPSAAEAACDIACATSGLPDTPQAAAQQLMAFKASGQLTQATIVNGSIFDNEIAPIASNTLTDATCRVDKRAMQTLIAIIRFTGSVQVTDLNRHCANDGKHVCPSNSPHCILSTDSDGLLSSTAMDIGATGDGKVDGYNNFPTTNLRNLFKALVPRVQATGFDRSGADMGQNLCSAASLDSDYFWPFDDQCTHQHADYRGNSVPLNISTSPVPPAFPILQSQWTVAYNTGGTLSTENNALQISNWARPMRAGSSPSISYLPDETWQAAYVGATGTLWGLSKGGVLSNWGFAVREGSNPSVAGLTNGKSIVAFVRDTGILWTVDSDGNLQNLGHYIAPNTSPSISALPNGGWVVAYQNGDGSLSAETNTLAIANYGLDVRSDSSPSVAGLTNGTYVIAFVRNVGGLWTVNSAQALSNFGHSIRGGTSPSIRALPNSQFVVAYANADCTLSAETSSLQISNYICMGSGSPSVTVTSDGKWHIAFVGADNWLKHVDSTPALSDLHHLLDANSSPSIG